MKVACKNRLFLIQLFLAKSDWDFFAKTLISSVETVVSEIKHNKPVKTDISIFLFYINSFRIYSTFFIIQGPQLGHAQHQKPRFFIAASNSSEGKTNHHIINHESCFQEKNCPNNCTNLNSMSLSSHLLTAMPVHNTCILPL